MNEEFDPNRHNAVFQVPDASKPANHVAVVLKVCSLDNLIHLVYGYLNKSAKNYLTKKKKSRVQYFCWYFLHKNHLRCSLSFVSLEDENDRACIFFALVAIRLIDLICLHGG